MNRATRYTLLACAAALLLAPRAALEAAETPSQRDARLAWWREARFGMFVHWGPSSLSGKEISWSRIGHPHDFSGNESVPAKEYDNLYKRFNPVKFDADAWIRLAQSAGMKYIVFTTKHHDGFSMWPTKLRADYSIAATPFHRDVCRELADAAHRQGLKLGWYYSTRDWTHPDYLVGDNHKYDEFYRGQVRELLSNYGRVDLLWFDHVAGNWRDYRFPELFESIYRLQPGILVNNRAAAFFQPAADGPTPEVAQLVGGDFDTPEQRIGNFQNHRPWESCMTITQCVGGGGWSYRPDGHTRSFAECVEMLVSCACGDGNLLLNVGPLPTGEIAADQQAVLRQIGGWLRRHGASIYATRGGPFRNGPWGGATFCDQTVYLHVARWTGDTLRLPLLRAKVLRVVALTGGEARCEQTPENLIVTLPASQQDKIDSIIKLELDAPAAAEFVDGKPLEVSQPAVLQLDSPLDYQVFQRRTRTEGFVRLSGRAPRGPRRSRCNWAATGCLSASTKMARFRRKCGRRRAGGMSAGRAPPDKEGFWPRPMCLTSAWARCSSSRGSRIPPTTARKSRTRRPASSRPSMANAGSLRTIRSPVPAAMRAVSCRPSAMRSRKNSTCPWASSPAAWAGRVSASGCRKARGFPIRRRLSAGSSNFPTASGRATAASSRFSPRA